MNRGIVFAVASAVLFGMSTPLAKTLVGTLSPLLLAGLLYAGSGLGLALIVAVRRVSTRRGSLSSLPRTDEWRWLVAAIFFGGVLGPAALMYGLVTSAASTASLLLNLEAVFTALLAWFLFKENFDRRIALGMMAIVGGGALLAWTPGERTDASLGLLLVVVACFCWALDNNLTRKVSGSDAVMVACLKGLVAGAVNIALALLLGMKLPAPGPLGAAALVGFFGYGVSLVLFVLALRHLGAARTSAYFSVAPFFGAALSFPLQGDPVTWQLVVAGLLMASGVWLHLTERHEHLHAHAAHEHSHSHVHDEHHQHTHDSRDGAEPHAHTHVHAPLEHAHAHYPDLHHRHPH
ncbi:MAG: EamA family transporter [Pseudomonadota bacterium]|nr:EamA family transporter [Pseudomonadota bacterium]